MTGFVLTVQMETVTVQLSVKTVEFSMKKTAGAFAPRVGTELHVKNLAIIWKTLVELVLAFHLGEENSSFENILKFFSMACSTDEYPRFPNFLCRHACEYCIKVDRKKI